MTTATNLQAIFIDSDYFYGRIGCGCNKCGDGDYDNCKVLNSAIDRIHDRARQQYPDASIYFEPKQYWASLIAAQSYRRWQECPDEWYEQSW